MRFFAESYWAFGINNIKFTKKKVIDETPGGCKEERKGKQREREQLEEEGNLVAVKRPLREFSSLPRAVELKDNNAPVSVMGLPNRKVCKRADEEVIKFVKKSSKLLVFFLRKRRAKNV